MGIGILTSPVPQLFHFTWGTRGDAMEECRIALPYLEKQLAHLKSHRQVTKLNVPPRISHIRIIVGDGSQGNSSPPVALAF